MPILRFLPQGLVLVSTLVSGLAATAAPIAFNVTGASFSIGSGYGTESKPDEESPGATRLKVAFDTSAFLTQLFSLELPDPPGSSTHSFTFGTIVFQEPDTNGGILAAETDNLDVSADLVFSDPGIGTRTLIGTGVAAPGLVGDADVDYALSWSPIVVDFGAGGQFRVSLDDLSWTGTRSAGSKNLTARITLLSAPVTSSNNDGPNGDGPNLQPRNNVPEPSTALLLGGALAALWRSRRQLRSDRI